MNNLEYLESIFPLQKEYLGEEKEVNKILPLVSVHVITYQHANFIRECLNGILMQETSFALEIVIGEDSSTDGTREICKEYAEKYPDKIRLFLRDRSQTVRTSNDKTVYFNGKLTLKACRGKFIALCEGDDYWTDPYKLQRQFDFLIHNPEYTLSAENSLVINTVANLKYNFSNLQSSDIEIKDLILSRKFHTASVVFRKDSFIPPANVIEYPISDTLMFICLAKMGKVHFNNIVSSVYNRNPKGLTEINRGDWARKIEKTSTLLDEFTNYEYTYIFKQSIARHYYSAYQFNRNKSDYCKVVYSALKAIKYDYRILFEFFK